MPKTRPPYPPEFRREALELLKVSGKSIAQVAKDLGCSEQTLQSWRRKAQVDEGEREGLSSSEREELRRLRKGEPHPADGKGDPEKSRGLLRQGNRRAVGEVFSFIAAEKTGYPVALLCRTLEVNRTSFHDWERRAPSQRALTDAWLSEKIKEIHEAKRKVYGAPRIHAELRMAHGVRVSRKRVERLMRSAGISGLVRRSAGARRSVSRA